MTKEKHDTVIPTDEFQATFKGKFYGVLKWDQLDDLWKRVKKAKKEGWYVYAIGDEPPRELVKGKALETVVNEINMLLRREHDEDYCGMFILITSKPRVSLKCLTQIMLELRVALQKPRLYLVGRLANYRRLTY